MNRYRSLRLSAYRSTTTRRELRLIADRTGVCLVVWQCQVGIRWTA